MYGLLNDAHFVLLVLFCAAAAVGSIITALTRVRRADFVRLQNELRELSEHVRELQMAEQRRFLKELNSRGEGPAADRVGTPQGNRVRQ
jgi:uncharacterized membrane protein (DUF106 family)